MGALKDRATVDRKDPLTLLAAIDWHLAALSDTKVAGVSYRRTTMGAMQTIRMKVLLEPFETTDRIE